MAERIASAGEVVEGGWRARRRWVEGMRRLQSVCDVCRRVKFGEADVLLG